MGTPATVVRYQTVQMEHYFAAQYKQRSGRRLGLATEGTKIIKVLVIGRPIRVLKVRGKERGYVSHHKLTTVKSWVDFITEAAPRLGITKEAEAMIQAARLQLEATNESGSNRTGTKGQRKGRKVSMVETPKGTTSKKETE